MRERERERERERQTDRDRDRDREKGERDELLTITLLLSILTINEVVNEELLHSIMILCSDCVPTVISRDSK